MKKIKYLILVLFLSLFIGKVSAYDYKTGDEVSYNNIKFYVIKNNNGVLTLIKSGPLLKTSVNYEALGVYQDPEEEITTDKRFYNNSKYLYIPYYNSDTCYNDDRNSSCTKNYDDSIVKKAVDSWIDNNVNAADLVEDSKGYKARLITIDELVDNFGFTIAEKNSEKVLVRDNNYPIFKKINTWTFDGLDDDNRILNLSYYGTWPNQVFLYSTINPVININADRVSLIEKNSDIYEIEKKSYNVGDIISFKGIEFYVLRDSFKDDDSVTLVKKDPLSYDDLYKYIEGYNGKSNDEYVSKVVNSGDSNPSAIINKMGDTSYGGIRFCNYNSDEECSNNYDSSPIKYIVDKWSEDIFGTDYLDKDVYGYTSRILNKDDLLDFLHYENGKTLVISSEYSILQYAEDTIDLGLYGCWTMSPVEDSSTDVFSQVFQSSVSLNFHSGSNSYATVCPVVTVKKGISKGDSSKIVHVPDTFIKNTLTIIVAGIFTIIIVIVIIIVLKKTRKR